MTRLLKVISSKHGQLSKVRLYSLRRLKILQMRDLVIEYKPIGVIHSPFKSAQGVPIQPKAAKEVEGVIEIFPDYVEGLRDLDGFSHIILIYHFHLVRGYRLLVKPYMDDSVRGVFATRAPARPNPIGISVVKLLKIDRNLIYVKGLDVVDGTPLLDIKPYVPDFDIFEVERIGWLERCVHKLKQAKDDGRFVSE